MTSGERIPESLVGAKATLAQVVTDVPPANTVGSFLGFDGSQFFTAWISGVLLALAFQFVLTNLGVATGFSLAGRDDRNRGSWSGLAHGVVPAAKRFGASVGIGAILSILVSLFLGTMLAVRLSLFDSEMSGAIVGLVIWATFVITMVWLSSRAVGSSIAAVMRAMTTGFRTILGLSEERAAERQANRLASAAVGAVRREFGQMIDPVAIRETLEDYLTMFKAPSLDIEGIAHDFERILEEEDPGGARREDLIDRQRLADVISQRSDISRRDAERLADRLLHVWQRRQRRLGAARDPLAELVDYLKTTTPQGLVNSELNQKLSELIDEMRQQRETWQATAGQQQQARGAEQNRSGNGMMMNALYGFLRDTVLRRMDLTDVDAGQMLRTLREAFARFETEGLSGLVGSVSAGDQAHGTVWQDVEHYLTHAYPWQFNEETLTREFPEVLVDPEASPAALIAELRSFHRSDFAALLSRSNRLSPRRVREVSALLDRIREDVLNRVSLEAENGARAALLRAVEEMLVKASKEQLQPRNLEAQFRMVVEDPNADAAQIRGRLGQFDPATLQAFLQRRNDLSPEEQTRVVNTLVAVRDQAIKDAEEQKTTVRRSAEQAWRGFLGTLERTGKEQLDPNAIENELRMLFTEPAAGWSAVQARLSSFDRDTLIKLLAQRPDYDEEQAAALIDRLERSWVTVARRAPAMAQQKVHDQYAHVRSVLEDYLRRTGRPELRPEDIDSDIRLLFQDPRAGTHAFRQRFAAMDRHTLVRLIVEAGLMREDQAERVVDRVLSLIRQIVGLPRRFAQRSRDRSAEFQGSLAEYLRNTQKEELNPEGIQRDLGLLLHDPRFGMRNLRDRLSHMDRSTLTALLAQRQDMTPEEAERVVDQILSVKDRMMERVHRLTAAVEAIPQRILARLREYLDSLDRPELNYDGLRDDLRKLFDEPGAGFDALRERLSQVDRGTVIALLSSRHDISRADAERIVSQVERTRDRLLDRARRMQMKAKEQMDRVREQTERAAHETRMVAVAASWWFFAIAITSALASAGAGFIGALD